MPARPHRVLVFAGGGLSPVSGGVGTLMRYVLAEWAEDPSAPEAVVIDTRGDGGAAGAAARLAHALMRLVGERLRGGAELVHAHVTTRGSVLRKGMIATLASLLGARVILHMHGADFEPFYRALPWGARAMVALVLRRADAVIVMGEGWRDFLVREAGVAPARVRVVPNGVPRRPLARGSAVPRILFLGRIGARKGVPQLIEALASPGLRALPWLATLAGDGDAAPYRARLRALGLGERVFLPGWIGGDEVARLLDGADVLVLPSHHEAMPMAVLEAMAAGVAVITTPVGIVPEFLEDGVNGRLVPPGGADRLAAAIGGLLQDAAARRRMAAAGRATFLERFDVRMTAAAWRELYRDVLDGAAAGGTAPAAIGAR